MRGRGGLEHSWSVRFLHPHSGTEQMLSHGTADVVLEACTDFWDGADIYPLSGSDRWVRRHEPVARAVGSGGLPAPPQAWGAPGPPCLTAACFPGRKKVLDFYQRACLSGYCSAFAYKPMSCSLSSQLNGKCIELVQAPGQSSIFTVCELPSTVPIKLSARRSSWSSDGTVRGRPRGPRHGEGFPRATESSGAGDSAHSTGPGGVGGSLRLLMDNEVLPLPSSWVSRVLQWDDTYKSTLFKSYKAAAFLEH